MGSAVFLFLVFGLFLAFFGFLGLYWIRGFGGFGWSTATLIGKGFLFFLKLMLENIEDYFFLLVIHIGKRVSFTQELIVMF